MDKLTNEFKDSLICNTEDVFKDCLELGIDNFIEDGILKDIPIVNSIVSGLKIAKNIYDRNLLKQTLTFIKELNNGTINKEKLIAYRSTIENNTRKCEEELGRVLLYLNMFIDEEKSIMLAKLFKAYIGQIINWNEFCEYSEIINRIFLEDLLILKYIKEGAKYKGKDGDNFRVERLYSLGILGNIMFADYEKLKENIIEGRVLNSIGKKICIIIL